MPNMCHFMHEKSWKKPLWRFMAKISIRVSFSHDCIDISYGRIARQNLG